MILNSRVTPAKKPPKIKVFVKQAASAFSSCLDWRGKKLHEHQVELMLAPVVPGWKREPCHWASWEIDCVERPYFCNHVWICVTCGKHMKDTKRWDCPLFAPYEPVGSCF